MQRPPTAARALLLACLLQGLWSAQAAAAGPQRSPAPAPKQQAAAGAAPKAPGYVATDTGHYKVHAERVAWHEAQAACHAEGAHLLVLNSRAEAAAVRPLLAQPPTAAAVSNELHAGFHRPDYFVTVFGAPLSTVGYQEWAPDQKQTQICGSIDREALLFDAKCADKRSFVCELHKRDAAGLQLDPPPITLPDGKVVPARYAPKSLALPQGHAYKRLVQQGRAHFYAVEKRLLTWSQADAFCREQDAHLLIVNHRAEADALRDHLKQLSGLTDLYVGLRNGDNKFVTLFGKTPVGAGYSMWESEQPDDETCLAVDTKLLLKKVPCWEERNFVCERTLA